MHNLYLNETRQAGKVPVVGSIEDYGKSIAAQSNADSICAISDFEQSLNKLSPEHRETLLLIGLEQLSYKEAAKVAGVPVGTIMSRLSRAREQLSKNLDGEVKVTSVRRIK